MLKVKNVKVNYVLNITRIISSTLIGLFMFPYINKTLGVNTIGKYEFSNSIITYFVLFSSLGIPMYGIREIARVRDSIEKRTKVLLELLIILVFTTITSYIIFFFTLRFSVSLLDYKNLLLIISPSIFFTNIGVEWFFQGIEDQLYITVRFLIVKIIALVLLFTLVKDENDILIYGAIMTFFNVGANIFNFFYIRKFLDLSKIYIHELNWKKHLRGVITIFLATISVSIYIQVDNTLLGYLVGDKYVGLYSTANKLIRFAILFITTLGAVMLPRLSYFIENRMLDDYNFYLRKSLRYILFFSVPISVLFFLLADQIIEIMAGKEFIESVVSMKILSPLILIVGLAYFLAFMVLYPQGKEKIYTLIVFITAILSIILNIILIPKFYHIATSWVGLISEFFGVVLMVIFARKHLAKIGFFSISNLNYFISGAIICIFFAVVKTSHNISYIIISILISLILYVASLFFLKDYVVLENYEIFKKFFKKSI